MKKIVVLLVILSMLLCGCVPSNNIMTGPNASDPAQTDPLPTEIKIQNSFISEADARIIALRDKHGENYREYEKKSIVKTALTNSPRGYYYIVTWIPFDDRAFIREWKVDAITGEIFARNELENPSYVPDSIVPTEPTVPEETTAPTELTAVYELEVQDWLIEEPEYLSYDEYFSKNRDYNGGSDCTWIKGNQMYRFVDTGKTLIVRSYQTEEEFLVSAVEEYCSYYVAGSDGRYGYLYNQTEFLRINLVDGVTETLLTVSDFCGFYLYDNLVAYYGDYDGEVLTIGRLYLPTLKNDILYQQEGKFYDVFFQGVNSTSDDLTWSMMNPEMISIIKTELADQDSQYKSDGDYDYSRFWEMDTEEAINGIIHNYPQLFDIQEGSGIRAFLLCSYDMSDGSYQQKTGIIDSCWFGSGYPHDHYNTEITTAPEPEFIMGQWTAINAAPDFALYDDNVSFHDYIGENKNITVVTGTDSFDYLYGKTDGDYVQIVSEPVKAAMDTGSCAIYVTEDDRVVAISYDGMNSVQLYKAVHGQIVDAGIGRGNVYIQDGTTMVQIDLKELRSRELVCHNELKWFMIDEGTVDSQSFDEAIYFEVYIGMYVAGYVLNLNTGELYQQYRL